MLAGGRIARRQIGPVSLPSVVGRLWSGSTAVPPDLLGLCIHSFPKGRSGVASPAPAYDFHTWRVHDYAPSYNYGVFWRALHVASGDFTGASTGYGVIAGAAGSSTSPYASDHWAELDQAVDTHFAAGRSIAYSIWGTPQWAATTPNQDDPYGGRGGNSPPSSQAHLSEFVTRLVQRYNTDLIRNNGGAKKLKYIEPWNEPTYNVAQTSFFIGTAADLAAMARTVKVAAKAVDPSIIVLSPSFTGSPAAYVSPFLNASDGAGGFGRDHVEGIGFHPYQTQLPGFPGMGGVYGTPVIADATLRAAMVAGGLASDFPVYGMEHGLSSNLSSTILKYTSQAKAAYVARITALYAALGWKKVTWYSHDDELSGNPSASSEVSAALQWAANLGGKTLNAIDLMSDGTIRVALSTGEIVSF